MKSMKFHTGGSVPMATLKTMEDHRPGSVGGKRLMVNGSQVGHVKKVGMQSGKPADAPKPSTSKFFGHMMQSVKRS